MEQLAKGSSYPRTVCLSAKISLQRTRLLFRSFPMARWIVWCFFVGELMTNQSIWPGRRVTFLSYRWGVWVVLSYLQYLCSIFALSFRSISVCVLLHSEPKARTRVSFVIFRWCRTWPYYGMFAIKIWFRYGYLYVRALWTSQWQ